MSTTKRIASAAELAALSAKLAPSWLPACGLRAVAVDAKERRFVLICYGGGCIASGAVEVRDAMAREITKSGLNSKSEDFRDGLPGSVCRGARAGGLSGRRALREPESQRMRRAS